MSRVPSKIGKYVIHSKIAEGGMGAVYLGTHPTLEKKVILKKLTLKGSSQFIERFRREAQIMMNFKNDNIVSVYDHFKAGDSYYIVLEYIDGVSLGDLIRKERYLPEDIALYIMKESALALSYAHKRNVVHRDIKPANLLISKTGEIKLVDFGVAHMGDDEDSELTTDGMTIGTPSYMAPEQFKDSKGVDNRADIYSLGVMLYEMLTGQKPFPGNFSPEAIAKIQKGKYVRAKKHNPAISRKTEALMKKAMKAKLERRFKTADQIYSILQRTLGPDKEKDCQKRLVALLKGEQIKEDKGLIVKKRILLWSAVAFFLISSGLASWRTGIIYEVLMPGQYGRINFLLQAPAELHRASEIYNRVQVFYDDDASIPLVNRRISLFRYFKKTPGKWQFRSMPLYLKSGHYRVKFQAQEHLYWYNFYLPPRIEQRLNSESERGMNLIVNISNQETRSLDINYQVSDSYTGRSLNATVNVEYFDQGRWQIFSDQPLMSNQTYKIRVSNPGYYTKEYHLRVAAFQEELKLIAALVPLPGHIILELPEESIMLQINGEDYYPAGGSVGINQPLESRLSGNREYSLPPGFYTLDLSFKKSLVSLSIDLKSNDTQRIVVRWDAEAKELIVR
ncbi:MAG: serine/threonine-protein kinase [Spirochaetaceae bacterium]|jgi:serine/threonine protein kinase|nr:serine/threonine-protein kinase [Spirochaetaceae bacterium]